LMDGSSRRWPADGAVHPIRFPRATVEVRIEDEAGKVNPNFASPELLRALLVRIGADARTAASIAAAIVDWRSESADPNPLGAKAAQYAAAGRDYGPPGAPFQSLDELGEVLGMTPELLARLRPHLSLFSQTDPLASTTDPVVAMAIRDTGGAGRAAANGRLQVALITARAQGLDGARFTRRAAIRIGGDVRDRPWKVLAWTRSED
jgi:general secretion pathway protein K